MKLVRAHVEGIQSWISQGFTKLNLVRGGSILLQQLFERELPQRLDATVTPSGWQKVSIISGSLAVLVDDDRAAAVEQALLDKARKSIPGLPFAVGSINYREREVPGWPDSWRRTLEPVAPPGVLPCAFSGDVPAEGSDYDEHAAAEIVKKRSRTIPDTTASESFEMTAIAERTRSKRFAGYVGVIVADGDGIGVRVAEAAEVGIDALKSLNEHLAAESAALVEGAKQAGIDRLGSDRDTGFLWNPVITGGDDITVVVPADAAPAVALALTGQPPMPDNTRAMRASAAIVIASGSFPFYLAREHAEDLLAEAKYKADDHEAGIAFSVEVGANVGKNRWPVKASPYSRTEFESLAAAAASTNLSSSKLRQLVEAASIGEHVLKREQDLLADNAIDLLMDRSWGKHRYALGDLVDLRSLLQPTASPGGAS